MRCLPLALFSVALILASCSRAGLPRPRIGIAMHSFDDDASVAIRRSIETAAMDKADLAIIDGQNQQSAQDMQTDSFFERKLGAIAVDPVDVRAIGGLIAKAKARKIPIVFFDRRPSDEAMRSWDKLYFVGTREAEAGTAQGEMLAAYWRANPSADRNKDGTAQFLAIEGDSGDVDARKLAESCAKAMNAAGIRAERLASEPGEKIEGLIARFGDKIEAVICVGGPSALGAIAAFKAAGYFRPRKGMPIVALGQGDLPLAVAEALSAGTLIGAVFGDAESQGRAVFDLSLALARGANPAKAGWRVSDAKYVWIPYRKYPGNVTAKP